MRRIVAGLILLLALAAVPMKSEAASLPAGATFLWNDGDSAVYGRSIDVTDYGWYISVDLIMVPVSSEAIKRFRRASGFKPGYLIATYAFDKYKPMVQPTKMTAHGEMGEYDSYNPGLDPKEWKEIKATNFLALWKVLTGNP